MQTLGFFQRLAVAVVSEPTDRATTRHFARTDWIDAAIWLIVPATFLSLISIGFVSGDGLAQSVTYSNQTWSYNPNHLLLEPIGAWWQTTLEGLGLVRDGPDLLKLLSVLTGALAAGIFRFGIAAPIAAGRAEANLATAWVALGSAFSRLWISDETHMLQMPFLMAHGAFLIAFLRGRSWSAAILSGAFAGIAALVYVSNALVPIFAAGLISLWLLGRREWQMALRCATGIGAGSAFVAGMGFWTAWASVAPPGITLFDWVTGYGGSAGDRLTASYGFEPSLQGLAVSAARAIYGAVSSVVDVAPVVQPFRDGTAFGVVTALALAAAIFGGVFFLASVWLAVRRAKRGPIQDGTLLFAASLGAAVGAFAIYWNNSDAQFFFQLSLATGIPVAAVPIRAYGPIIALAGLALTWNAWDMIHNRVMYPRAERVAALRGAVQDAGLVVYPGWDEVDHLLYFVPELPQDRRLTMMSLAAEFSPEDGLRELQTRIRETADAGETVVVISIFDVPPSQNPWRHLESVGYSYDRVLAAFQSLPVDVHSHLVGSFPVRTIQSSRPSVEAPGRGTSSVVRGERDAHHRPILISALARSPI